MCIHVNVIVFKTFIKYVYSFYQSILFLNNNNILFKMIYTCSVNNKL
jgi:hypothetical protein